MPYYRILSSAGAYVIGADIGPNQKAHIQISDQGGLPIANESFDYVVSFQVLEHVATPHVYLIEANRILKPNGKLFLTTHGTWPYHPTPGDYHRWTKDGLIYEMKKAGFDICSIDSILNEYSAALQLFVMTGDYRRVWRRCRKLVHLVTNLIIWALEQRRGPSPQLPAILCVLGIKI